MSMDLETEPWRHWRRTKGGLTWRVAVEQDLPAIERVWKAKARVLGAKCELPDLFAWPVVITLVAEDERGRVVDGVFIEAVADVTKLGGTSQGFESLAAIEKDLAGFLASRKFRRITAAMPARVSEKMADGLKGAGFEPQQLCLWDRWLPRVDS